MMRRLFKAAVDALTGRTSWPEIEVSGKLDPGFDIQSRIRDAALHLPPAISAVLQKGGLKFCTARDFGAYKEKHPTRFADLKVADLLAAYTANALFSSEEMAIFVPQFRRVPYVASTQSDDTAHSLRHECGHAMDEIVRRAAGGAFSQSPDFTRAFDADKRGLMLTDQSAVAKFHAFVDLENGSGEQARTNRSEIMAELFAEALDDYAAQRTGKPVPDSPKLTPHFPQTAKLVKQLVECPALFTYSPRSAASGNHDPNRQPA